MSWLENEAVEAQPPKQTTSVRSAMRSTGVPFRGSTPSLPSTARLSGVGQIRGFASPPHDGFALSGRGFRCTDPCAAAVPPPGGPRDRWLGTKDIYVLRRIGAAPSRDGARCRWIGGDQRWQND